MRLAIGFGFGAFGFGVLVAPLIGPGPKRVALWVADRDANQLVAMDRDFLIATSAAVESPVRVEAMGDGGAYALSAIGGSPIGPHGLVHVDSQGGLQQVGVLGAGIDLAKAGDDQVFVVEMGLWGADSRVLRVELGQGAPVGAALRRDLVLFAVSPGATSVGVHVGKGASRSGLSVLVGSDTGTLTRYDETGARVQQVTGLAGEIADVAPGPDGGWWVLDVAAPNRLLRLDRDLDLLWAVETGLHSESLAPVQGEERVWIADSTEPLVRRFGPGGVLELSAATVATDFSRGAGLLSGEFWVASPGAALRIDGFGAGLPSQGGFDYLVDLSSVQH